LSNKNGFVIFGGCSNEYEVSLRTAGVILENIDRELFSPLPRG
jgi:D-alanine-D-alanine ligase-like ATP-grasp enzyme